MSRRCGSGPKSHSFCAMYSLKMSVCSVPLRPPRSTPCRSAATRYMQNTGTAGPEMVIDVVTSPSGMSANRVSMSAALSMATPQWPTSPEAVRVVGVAAHEGRHVEGDREAAAPALEDHLVALVGLHGVAEPGELADGPRPPAVARRIQAARERVLPRPADPLEAVPLLVGGRLGDAVQPRAVDRLHGVAGEGGEVGLAHAPGGQGRVVALLPAGGAAVGRGRVGAHGTTLLGRPTN